jgi:hypothetical protein
MRSLLYAYGCLFRYLACVRGIQALKTCWVLVGCYHKDPGSYPYVYVVKQWESLDLVAETIECFEYVDVKVERWRSIWLKG